MADAATIEAPGLGKRLLCLVYEGVVMFGVVMAAGLLYGTLTEQRHALKGTTGLQAFLFIVLGVYFTWFWSQGRQTIAMKTWRMRLVTAQGHSVSQPRALARYLASWLWFLPALATVWLAEVHSAAVIGWSLFAGSAAYAGLALLLPGRQYVHDLLCGTRLQAWTLATADPAGALGPHGQNQPR